VKEERFNRINNILNYKTSSIQDLLDYALHEVIALTKSKIGYIYHYSEQTKQFTLNTWSKDVMKACKVQKPRTIYELDKTGIWGEAVRQRKAVMINDFAAPNPLKKGYPKGHVKLERYLTIPILNNNEIIAVVAVANKETNYTTEDIDQLEIFMSAVWIVVEHIKLEDELRAKTDELTNLNKYFIGREVKMAELKEEINRLKPRGKPD
jgi:GAF domain-containing protein